jgi:hypothetical protein
MATPEKEHAMKTTVRNFAVLVVFAIAVTGISLAQTSSYRLTADIPFDFVVEDQHLPAGNYMIIVGYNSPVVTLRNTASGRTAMVIATHGDGQSNGEPVVDFDVVGDTHLLADLKTANTGVSFTEQKQSLASAKRKASVAIVASLR